MLFSFSNIILEFLGGGNDDVYSINEPPKTAGFYVQ